MEFLKTVFGDKALTYADFAAAAVLFVTGRTETLAQLNITVGPARGAGRPPRR